MESSNVNIKQIQSIMEQQNILKKQKSDLHRKIYEYKTNIEQINDEIRINKEILRKLCNHQWIIDYHSGGAYSQTYYKCNICGIDSY